MVTFIENQEYPLPEVLEVGKAVTCLLQRLHLVVESLGKGVVQPPEPRHLDSGLGTEPIGLPAIVVGPAFDGTARRARREGLGLPYAESDPAIPGIGLLVDFEFGDSDAEQC